MKLILVRHGEAFEGDLTLKGVHQAVATAKELTKQKIDTIYCSPAPRCEQTMDEILRLRDGDMKIHFTSLVGPKLKKESYEKLKARVELFLDDLKYDHEKEETILVITHQRVIGMALFLAKLEVKKLENAELFEIVL